MQQGSTELYRQIRGVLVMHGLTLNKWAKDEGVSRQWAELALSGKRKGPAAQRLIVKALKFTSSISQ